jgi:hypothetical protein
MWHKKELVNDCQKSFGVKLMEREALYERIKIQTWQQQLGNLASTLATISTQASIPQQDKLTTYLLRDAALIIEWCAKNVPESFHPELAAIQKECLAWKQVFPLEATRNLLSIHTRHQSDRILEMAGLSNEEISLKTINH